MDGVVLELVGHVVGGGGAGVDELHVAVGIVCDDAGYEATDAPESVHSHAGGLEGGGGGGLGGGGGAGLGMFVSVSLLLLLLCFVVIIYRFVGQVSGEFGYMCIYTCSWVF